MEVLTSFITTARSKHQSTIIHYTYDCLRKVFSKYELLYFFSKSPEMLAKVIDTLHLFLSNVIFMCVFVK